MAQRHMAFRRSPQWEVGQHEIAAREMAPETQWYAITSGEWVVAAASAGNFIPEPATSAGTVCLGLDHDRPSLEIAIVIVHFLDC